MKQTRKAFETEFEVYSPEDIRAQQDVQINEVSTILGQQPEASAILLRFARWNREKLLEQYMDQQDAVLESAGLGPSTSGPPKIESIKDFTCEICYEDEEGMGTYALKCGHRYCVDCYRRYLSHKIKEEGEAARIQCPKEGCNRVIDSKSLNLLVADDLKDR